MRDDREGRVFPSLRYAHVHGRQIDEAIRVIGRTLPKGLGNETALTMTQELPTAANVAPIKGTEKPKDGLLFQGFVGWRPEAGLASICGTGLNIIRWDNTIPPCSVVFRPHCPTDRP
jgi:hypothetical protein